MLSKEAKEKRVNYTKKWKKDNIDRWTAYQRQWEIDNREKRRLKHKIFMRKWSKQNKERIKIRFGKNYYKNIRNQRMFGGRRYLVLKRDKYMCQECGMTNKEHILNYDREINIHHIDGNGTNAKIKNNDINNLITLCLKCHGKKDNELRKRRKK